MPNEHTEISGSLIPTITRLVDTSINEEAGLDNLVTILSLLCLICVFTRHHSAPSHTYTPKEAANTNPINKLIGDLMKGDSASAGGNPQEALMSLLPLLNNPQLKSKLNPSTIASVLGLLNNFGGSSSEKQDGQKERPKEKSAEKSKESPKVETDLPSEEDFTQKNDSNEQEGKSLGRYLNWKTNF